MTLYIILALIWVAISIPLWIFIYNKGKKALSIFPEISPNDILYHDSFASGYSKSWPIRIGSPSNALEIVVTEKELWLKTMVLFASIQKFYDIIHKISLDKIHKVETKGRLITLSFTTETGENKQVVIKTKKPDDFLNAITRK